MEALKLVVILVAIIVALRRKLPVGATLFGAGVLTAILYMLPFSDVLEGYRDVLTSRRFILLTGLVVSISILGNLLSELGFLNRMATACQLLPGGSRSASMVLPPLVGLMPMPAGSLLSAPLVAGVLGKPEYKQHFKCAVNYWFRHMVEFSWPIYPGLILTEAITGMPIARVSFLQFPLTLMMFVIGYFFFARRIDTMTENGSNFWLAMRGMAGAIWPVLLAIFLYGIFKVELALAVLISLVLMVIVARPSKESLKTVAKRGLSYKLVILIFGILSFQKMLELSGGIRSIPDLASTYHLPDALVIFLVCFTAGLLTGMVAAYVGLSYTLLAGLLYQPVLDPGNIMLAYLSGFIGMMFSPSHLCLIATNEYFGSDIGKVYRTILIPLILLGIAGFLLYLSAYGSLFS